MRPGLAGVEQRQDIRVLELRGGLDLHEEARGADRFGQLGLEDLEGDLTVEATPVTTPIDVALATDPTTRELAELFNAMLAKAQAALQGYNDMREELRRALGDDSCLAPLKANRERWQGVVDGSARIEVPPPPQGKRSRWKKRPRRSPPPPGGGWCSR